jgi:predicted RNase H-like HicB family nuclease
MAQGATLEEAIGNLKDARIDYIYDSLKEGIAVPDPAQMVEPMPNTPSDTFCNQTILRSEE